MSEQLNLDNQHGWKHGDRLPENATYESEEDRLIREIRDISNYLVCLETRLAELTEPSSVRQMK